MACAMLGLMPPSRIVLTLYYIKKNERAKRAHSYYTCLKHQLMHQLYSSALPWIILDPRLYNGL